MNMVLQALGRLHLERGEADKAVDLFSRGLDCARRSGFKPAVIDHLVYLAQAWSAQGATEQALDCATEAVALATTAGSIRRRFAAAQEYESALAATRTAS